ncbi:alpha/beta hydrolase [Mycobacterium branderi]|uniref:Acetyl hydrolase n=1 Tax=Mycobacterium branderi TaxID=43348 RepID=A0A7I7W8F4_9MYCO|nr:alpha/beta hydrolase [Mycobacterium branderi]MCV7234403.1 alpha/beta hydrolase [Mycobacterium branderi]ORA38457.1 acetyl hydrolase [Mycobacterium branderi]BBZ13247.1 acetylhydrolase [Mycobacterium branderi]
MTDDVPARGSLRSRAAAVVSALTLRQISAVLPPERAWGLWLSRQIVAGIMDAFGPSLAGARVEPTDTTLSDGRRVVGEWVRGPGGRRTDAVVYYVHGSGYALCSPRTHRRLTAWLSRLTGLPVFSIDYRLAPRHRFPTAADDVRAGWDWLSHRIPAERIVVAGDSAGGHLTVDLLLQPEVAASRPAALVLFSPLIDLTFASAAERERRRPDPAIRAADALRLVELYCGGTDPAHCRLSLDVAGGPALPPTLIQAGGAEMLAADAERLAAEITAGGGRCELQVWPDQAHVFQALPRLSPEARNAMAYAAHFITDALNVDTVERAS